MIKSRKRRPPQHSEVRIGVLTVVPTPGCESLKCSAGRIISSSCSAPIAQRQIASHGLCANLELTLECVNKNGGSTLPGKGFPWRFHYSLSFDAGEDCLHRRGPVLFESAANFTNSSPRCSLLRSHNSVCGENVLPIRKCCLRAGRLRRSRSNPWKKACCANRLPPAPG